MNRADAKIQKWKQSFLDLSSRNPQLNFSPQKYIELIHPDLATIFKILVVLNQKAELPSVYAGAAKKKKKGTKASKKSKKSKKSKAKGASDKDDEVIRDNDNGSSVEEDSALKLVEVTEGSVDPR